MTTVKISEKIKIPLKKIIKSDGNYETIKYELKKQ